LIRSGLTLTDYEMNPDSPVLRITRAGNIISDTLPGADWTVFISNHSSYEPISWALATADLPVGRKSFLKRSQSDVRVEMGSTMSPELDLIPRSIPVILDSGTVDGIRRVLFGNGVQFWLHRLLFIDSLSFLSFGRLSSSMDRYVLVDIDDVFVGRSGTRVTSDDVKVSHISCLYISWMSIVHPTPSVCLFLSVGACLLFYVCLSDTAL